MQASQESARISAQVAREQLDWAREQYFLDRDVADIVIESALERQELNDQWAAADRERYEQYFQPLEQDLVRDAEDFASPERIEQEAGRAQADVSQQFAMARNAAQAQLEGFGVDPSQTRAQALDISARTQEAAARAGAGNQARQQTEAIGRALRSEAINLGRGYPGQIAGTYGTALQSGNQAVNSGIATTATGTQAAGSPVQWQGASNQALGVWGNALDSQGDYALNAWKAEQQQSSGIGSALGLIGGLGIKAYSAGMFGNQGGMVPDVNQAIPTGYPAGNAQHSGIPVPPEASPSGGAVTDDVPARVQVGEFIVPEDAVQWKGEEFFQKLIQKSRADKEQAQAKPTMAMVPDEAPAIQTALPTG